MGLLYPRDAGRLITPSPLVEGAMTSPWALESVASLKARTAEPGGAGATFPMTRAARNFGFSFLCPPFLSGSLSAVPTSVCVCVTACS